MSCATTAANTMESVSRATRPSRHISGSISASSAADRACSSTRPSSSSAGEVRWSAMSIRVMCLTPVHPSAAARGTLATRRSSSSKTEPASPVRFSER